MLLLKIVKKILKYLFITLFVVFIIASILPYFFSIEHKKLSIETKPFENSYFFTSHNTRIHYRIWKPQNDSIKTYVLFVHGFSGSTFSYRNNVDTLQKNSCLVVAIDLPAFGYSDKSDTADYTDTARVEIIHDLLQQIEASVRWNLIGHSMGASIIANYACKHPTQTKSLSFIDGPAFESKGEGPGFASTFIKYPPIKRWAEVLAKHKFASKASFEELLSSAYSAPADTEAVNGYMKPFEYERSASAIFDMAVNTGYAEVNKITMNKIPMLLVWGQNDQWIPISTAKSFIEQNPSIVFHTIKGAGHCPMETHPYEVNALLVEFICTTKL
jgi:2-hydroxy-6-oxonona-2,4-dienedioate hydrolase